MDTIMLSDLQVALEALFGKELADEHMSRIEIYRGISAEHYLQIRVDMKENSSEENIKQYFGYIYFWYLKYY